MKRQLYLWLFKHWVEQGIDRLDMDFETATTKEAIQSYWSCHGEKEPVAVYPAVNLDKFWCFTPLSERKKCVVYFARFIQVKRP